MDNRIRIRKYQTDDIGAMVTIWNEVVEEGIAFPQEDCLTAETGEAFFAGQSHCGVAEDTETGTVLGLYILHPNNIGRCGHICNASYAVLAEERGKHIGEKLVRDCMERAAEIGFRILQFNAVVATNASARHLYEKIGFRQLGVIPGGFRLKSGKYEDICPYYVILESPELSVPISISARTLQDMDKAISNFKLDKVSPVIDLSDLEYTEYEY